MRRMTYSGGWRISTQNDSNSTATYAILRRQEWLYSVLEVIVQSHSTLNVLGVPAFTWASTPLITNKTIRYSVRSMSHSKSKECWIRNIDSMRGKSLNSSDVTRNRDSRTTNIRRININPKLHYQLYINPAARKETSMISLSNSGISWNPSIINYLLLICINQHQMLIQLYPIGNKHWNHSRVINLELYLNP